MADGTHYVLLDRVALEPLCGNLASAYGWTVSAEAVTCSECLRRMPRVVPVPIARLRRARVAVAAAAGEPTR
jgi:hypothetical protein